MKEHRVYNRKKKQVVNVRTSNARAMKFLHTRKAGKFLMNNIASLQFISILLSFFKYTPLSRFQIKPFIEKYKIKTSEFENSKCNFKSFNDFFIRKLKPGARVVNPDPNSLVSPADGAILVYDNIGDNTTFSIKGNSFSLRTLLGDNKLASKFKGGSLAIVYLAPFNYHRFHFPCDGHFDSIKRIGNKLLSVSPISLENGFRPFDVNVRDITEFTTYKKSKSLIIEVGACYVGRIVQTSATPGNKTKGMEKGYFGLGASTVVLVYQKDAVSFDYDLVKVSKKNISSLVKQGMKIGTFN
jgi:phosphatidylserine decarboxylase